MNFNCWIKLYSLNINFILEYKSHLLNIKSHSLLNITIIVEYINEWLNIKIIFVEYVNE